MWETLAEREEGQESQKTLEWQGELLEESVKLRGPEEQPEERPEGSEELREAEGKPEVPETRPEVTEELREPEE